MHSNKPSWIKKAAVTVAVAALAACATPPPPPPPPAPPPPPPPVAEVIPYRPIPPNGATYAMDIPPIGPGGARITVNSGLDENGKLWHLRSAWNVAALNCMEPHHAQILEGYGQFLTKNRRKLTAVNTAIDAHFRKQHGSRNDAIKAREAYMTQVYNFFALPPARADFCNTAQMMATDFLATQPEDPVPFAVAQFDRIEAAFESFFRAYEQYRADSGAWDLRYGSRYGSSQPGYLAVHGTGGPTTVATTLAGVTAIQGVGGIFDADSGARIPLIAVPEGVVSTPVVQPVQEKE